MAPLIPVIVIVVRLVLLAANSKNGSSGAAAPSGPKRYSWTLISFAWCGAAFFWFSLALPAVIVPFMLAPRSVGDVLSVVTLAALAGLGGWLLFRPWSLLLLATRRGRPKLVYYLAYLLMLFPFRGDTRSGACLLATLALARRGKPTEAELAWIKERLAKETRTLGAFGAAYAMHLALTAKRARDAGDQVFADDLAEQARAIFGTVTYLSERGAPHCVRRVVWEYMALEDAGASDWCTLEGTPLKDLSPVARVLRDWAREWLLDQPAEAATTRLRRRLASPAIDSLFVRPREVVPATSAPVAWARARRTFIALASGKPVGPRRALSMLATYDALTHPECPDTILPEEIRTNEELVNTIHDEIAAAIAKPLLRIHVPLHAMQAHGPITARVYAHVETERFSALERALVDLERSKNDIWDGFGAWSSASRVRLAFRRLESSLGTPAAARVWSRFAHDYCNFGVSLSEEAYPRKRPLAHAIFNAIHGDAARFDDKVHLDQQQHNMKVTAGIE